MNLSSHITKGHKSPSLITYLSNRFTYLSKEQWYERILDGSVLVNDVGAHPELVLHPGDIVSYYIADFPEPDADTNYTIAFEDEWLICVNKPGNLLVHKAGKSITKNLVFLLRHSSGNPLYERVNAVSRLDRETSGAVLFSKDMDCLKELHRDFVSGAVAKEYVAVVHHVPAHPLIVADQPIGQDTESAISYKYRVDKEHGKSAQTEIELISSRGEFSLVRARPRTGRTHQIRIHCAFAGIPVVGDKLYGLPEQSYLLWRKDPRGQSSLVVFARQALHCSRLEFTHPATKLRMSIESPLPADILMLIEKLGLPLRK